MLPIELTVEQVKTELQSLIDAEPNNTGWADVGEYTGDSGCVYFLDQDGKPILINDEEYSETVLATPVCIIGRWIHDFHPEWMETHELNLIFRENRSLASCQYDQPFRNDVFRVLQHAQGIQDLPETTWSAIDLENPY